MRYLQHKKAVVFNFTATTPAPINLPVGYSCTQISHESLNRFFSPESPDWRSRSYRQLLDKGYIGFLIHDQTEWAAVQWLATPESPSPPHLPTKICQDKFWCFNEHTREAHRRIGLWRTLKSIGIRHVLNSTAGQATTIYSDTGHDNLASRKAHERFGFKPAGTIDRFSIRIPKITTVHWGTWSTEQTHPPL